LHKCPSTLFPIGVGDRRRIYEPDRQANTS